jgi:TPR repeat protein
MRCFLPVLAMILMLVTPAVGQDYKKGMKAYERGDYVAALRELRPLAKKGDAAAQLNLGNMYLLGQGVPQDYGEAVNWFRRAAEQPDGKAQHLAQINLGNLYFNGLGVRQDYLEAAKWYRMAADQGDAEAQGNLGLMYAAGKGVRQDQARGVSLLAHSEVEGILRPK